VNEQDSNVRSFVEAARRKSAAKEGELLPIVEQFIDTLRKNAPNAESDLVLEVLWRFYLEPEDLTQPQIALELGVSEYDVHDCRVLIENELRAPLLSDIDDAHRFESMLRQRLRGLISTHDSAHESGY